MLHLVHSVKVSYEPGCYVFDGIPCNAGKWLAVSNSNHAIRLYDINTSRYLCQLDGHLQQITDMTTNPSDPHMLYSAQRDTGVMISDLRQAKPVHFLTELTGAGQECFSISVAPTSATLAVSATGDIHIVDMRTWSSKRILGDLHTDNVTRFRWVSDSIFCSSGEDGLVNFGDVGCKDDDLLQSVSNITEPINRMTYHPSLNAVAMTGSMENAFLFPTSYEMETKLPRRSEFAYLVDSILVNGRLYFVWGSYDENEVGHVDILPADGTTNGAVQLRNAHQDVVRFAHGLGPDATTVLTGGEDGLLAWWSTTAPSAEQAEGFGDGAAGSAKPTRTRTTFADKSKPY